MDRPEFGELVITNHLRTTLLNLPPVATDLADPAEEYVPADFKPKTLPAALSRDRSALFGPGHDRAGANGNLARLLAVLHASEMAPDVTTADPRITYDPTRPTSAWRSVGTRATALGASPEVAGYYGEKSFPQSGRAYGYWAVTTSGGQATSTPRAGATWAGAVTTVPAGDAVPLPGSRLHVVVPSGADGSWTVTLFVPPSHSFTRAAETGSGDVFAPAASDREAYWYEVWNSDALPHFRAAAFALALAARIDEV